MAITNTPPPARPAKDEWGVYDPQQAGLEALFARLDRAAALVVVERPTPAEAVDVPEPPPLGDPK